MTRQDRPLSPHLQIYRPQITSVLSILHRITGVSLALGVPLFAWWLAALATGPDAYALARGFFASPIGLAMLLGWSFAFFYHLSNGIRHLAWDKGLGFDLKTAALTGWLVVFASLSLTAFTWVLACPRIGIWS